MVTNISSVSIQGGIFKQETKLPIFEGQQKKRFCLVYGKNGSGKTTISRAFSKIAGNEENTIYTATLLDSQDNPIRDDSELEQSIFVFNEEFVRNNIQIEGDGLDTIIVIGAQKEIDDKIKKETPLLEQARENYVSQKNIVDEYTDAKNPKSPLYCLNRIVETLKEDKSWASRDAHINGKKQNTRVNDITYQQFKDLQTDKSRDELVIEFDNLSKDLEKAKNGNKIIREKVIIEPIETDDENIARNILAVKVEKPVLSERERYLFALLAENDGANKLGEIRSFFSDNDNHICPYCFQEVSEDYADKLVYSIEKILSKKADEHIHTLERYRKKIYNIDLTPFEILDGIKIGVVREALQSFNSAIDTFNECIERKQSNVYEEVVLPELKLTEKYNTLITALNALENDRVEYNNKASDVAPIIDKMKSVNNLIAMHDIKPMCNEYEKQLYQLQQEKAKLNNVEIIKHGLEKKIAALEMEKKNARIAMDSINKDLRYIFFSQDRLFIDYRDDKYILHSHGQTVEPMHVSIGERNAIGLCYFFNRIIGNKNEDTAYDQPYLIVIDDPVSSFDMENKIGILSYLKYALSKFALGHEDTRILLMTHDLQTLSDARKIIEELLVECKNKFNGREGQNKKACNVFELIQGCFSPCDQLLRNEYTVLLEQIYEYAKLPSPQYSLVIGNMMRKVLEAFGTFLYKKGIIEISTNPKIVGELDEPYRLYFQNLMYRLVLHGGSHMEDRVKNIDDMDFFYYISDSEKQRTAKDVLCFLYKLNEKHLMAHLASKESAQQDICQWCKENIEGES
ncbi:MAG: hypothetical protein E7197_04585 [Anaerovibrio sp.]|uniref:AAA family ATPase n=1 Tax=Anaerovibrio sp. TaxID=1872532 RepID=UPI0025C73206|nr:AAA family ATPase [Anaerovibrio sp.]MBE6099311.1 hypothetical protein [Anaerovibrio sp.]